MKWKIIACMYIVGLFFVISPSGFVQADMNVKECIENEDCGEDEAPAGTVEDSDTEGSGGTGSLLINLVKMAFALLLVLGLIYILLKFINKRSKRFQQVRGLENIGGVSVGSNKSVQLVRIGSKVFLVGVGENVELLREITDDETKEEILHNDSSEDNHPVGGLASLLQQKAAGKSENKHSSHFSQLFTTELEKLKRTRSSLLKQSKQKDDHYE
ncbi:flagellar biosynthetic protein FliO [Lentibacillus sp. CBA3610]|uniref:flagellar biosynthetic protein FliO n=1 Tax=Lentibacillus sp. CBA3610 TaxID=2518176 RepID=UPI001595D41C|nr:flagellar biosynthetic protein FliO [Lentibacillus sp. CBA3610]QKY69044.1 flagellar protein [Lentibacillus sp. CBA3610]